MGKPLKDETGARYGMWTVVSRAPNKGSMATWNCLCDCGMQRQVVGRSLRTGLSKSCGEHNGPSRVTHGMSGTKAYGRWCSIIARTEDPNNEAYDNYGGRGIRMVEPWRSSFESFYADTGEAPEGHSLERRDNNGPYSKENCYWATRAEQARNKRTNIVVEFEGRSQCLTDWAKELGIPAATLYHRHYVGITNPKLLLSKEKLLWMRKNKGESETAYRIRIGAASATA